MTSCLFVFVCLWGRLRCCLSALANLSQPSLPFLSLPQPSLSSGPFEDGLLCLQAAISGESLLGPSHEIPLSPGSPVLWCVTQGAGERGPSPAGARVAPLSAVPTLAGIKGASSGSREVPHPIAPPVSKQPGPLKAFEAWSFRPGGMQNIAF